MLVASTSNVLAVPRALLLGIEHLTSEDLEIRFSRRMSSRNPTVANLASR